MHACVCARMRAPRLLSVHEYACMCMRICVCVRDSFPWLLPEGLAAAPGTLLLAAGAGHGGHQWDGMPGSVSRQLVPRLMLPVQVLMALRLPGWALAPVALDAWQESGAARDPAPAPAQGLATPTRRGARGLPGLRWGLRGGPSCPPLPWPPSPAAQPTASCAGAHCSAVGHDSFVRAW